MALRSPGGSPLQIGQRVQVPPWTDVWMMGDRYGTVVKFTRARGKSGAEGLRAGDSVAHVLLDKSGRVRRFRTRDLEAA